jgi:hypothetical protein
MLRMAMGKRKGDQQPSIWVATTDVPTAASHPFYRRLNQLLREHGFDDFVEAQCEPYRVGRRAHSERGWDVHAGAFNLGLWMRTLFGVGTPRSLQGRAVALGAMITTLCTLIDDVIAANWSPPRDHTPSNLGFRIAESAA